METPETSLDYPGMDTPNVISEASWRVWEEKGRRHQKRLLRKVKIGAATLGGLAALAASAFYFVTR